MIATESTLGDVARHILRCAPPSNPCVIWLEGELGAGKTTLTRALLRCLGLPESIPVTSPTFSYVQEYQVIGRRVAHLDLYRLQKDNDIEQWFDLNLYDMVVVEWPREGLGLDWDIRVEIRTVDCATRKLLIESRISAC